MRLMALMIRTIQATVSGSANTPRLTVPHGSSRCSMLSPSAKASTAAATCQKSFTIARMPRTSSMTPTTTSRSAPARIAGARFGRRKPTGSRSSVATAAKPMATANAIAIATPPRRGTGNWWILRSASGWSSSPCRWATWRTIGVTSRLTTRATAEVRAVSIGRDGSAYRSLAR